MFEKEAEEYYYKKVFAETNPKNETELKEKFLQTFKDSAEFGYNKANEWHYVKDRLPETDGRYLVYTGGEPFILYFDTEVNSFGYWIASFGDNWGIQDEYFETVKDRGEDEVIAWKEIVPPKVK